LHMEAVQVINGVVRVGDWVRELPADHHFQPCYCCLCRPVTGNRPAFQVKGIGRSDDGTYLRFSDGSELPSNEYERVSAPESIAPRASYPNRSTLIRLLRTNAAQSA
jgi:hypothetical protein